MNFRKVQTEDDEEPQFVYVRDPQNFEPVGDSPIRQRMESLQQGSIYDSRPYAAPRERRGSPLRRKLEKVRQFFQRTGDQNMNMPVTGR